MPTPGTRQVPIDRPARTARPIRRVAGLPPTACEDRSKTSAQTIREALINTYSKNTGDRESVASNFNRIAERASDAPEVDSQLVASIRHALSRGQYRIEPDSIAEKLIHIDSTLQRLRRAGRP